MMPRRATLPAEDERLLEVRREKKMKKPPFMRQESWRYARIDESWRRPRGLDNKMRRKMRGVPKMPKIGYKGPRRVRGLHPSGFKEVLIYRVKDLEMVDPEREAVRIAGTVGRRKRLEMIKRADELDIRVLNRRI
jgi:large subunit ribosomal protein L32e